MMLPPKEGFMFRTILGALPLVLIAGATTAEAHGLHASLSDLVRQSDRIVVAKVEGIQSAFEEHTVAVRDGQPITGKFVFTYVEIRLPPSTRRPQTTDKAAYPGDPYSSADQRQLPGVSLLAGLQDQQIGS